MGQFVEVCRRRGLKVNAGKSKVMVMSGEEELVGFIYSIAPNSDISDVFCMKQVQMGQNIIRRRQVGGGWQMPSGPLVARDLQIECARVLRKTLLVPVLMYDRDNVMDGEI